jgi:actin-related protein 10
VGFSGEGRPRDVFSVRAKSGAPLWNLSRAAHLSERTEEDKMLEIRLEKYLRAVFHEYVYVPSDDRSPSTILPVHC